MNHVMALAGMYGVAHHEPLGVAIPIIAAVVILRLLVARARSRPTVAGKVVVRCSSGHVFTTTWSSFASITSNRLGGSRYQRCPVGHHWALVKRVNNSDLTDEERRVTGTDHT
jgi:hypothetical protein